jgi:hypothetical protein
MSAKMGPSSMMQRDELGVLVGSNRSQEWLLPWFFAHFRKYNPSTPLCFADFGMSPAGLDWCQQKGSVFQVPPIKKHPPGSRGVLFSGDFWEEQGLNTSLFTPERWVCFRKPFAILESPFQRTLWLDLDCEVRGDLSSLFATPLPNGGLAATPCRSFCHVKNLSTQNVFLIDKYNTGVVLVDKSSLLLKSWALFSGQPVSFRTDEGSLSFLASRGEVEMGLLSHLYNWPLQWGENEQAYVYHWMGREAKARLQRVLENER